jgi:hypothetical protein
MHPTVEATVRLDQGGVAREAGNRSQGRMDQASARVLAIYVSHGCTCDDGSVGRVRDRYRGERPGHAQADA